MIDEQALQNASRRILLGQGLAVAVTTLTGCPFYGSDVSSPLGAPPPASALPPATPVEPAPTVPAPWNLVVPPLLVDSNTSFDLSKTLPSTVPGGGRFGIDSTSAALPAGMSLTPAGILSVGSAKIGTVTGVVFTYETL